MSDETTRLDSCPPYVSNWLNKIVKNSYLDTSTAASKVLPELRAKEGRAMSMLSAQCARLRSWAIQFDERADIDALAPLLASDLREAADTIESLRNRLQESYGQVPERGERENEGERESYDAGFSNGVKACLQQLDGLIHEGADVDEIQGWIDRQWEEEVV